MRLQEPLLTRISTILHTLMKCPMEKAGAKDQKVKERQQEKAIDREESVLICCSTENVNVKTAGIRTTRKLSPLLKKKKVERVPQLQQ